MKGQKIEKAQTFRQDENMRKVSTLFMKESQH